MARYVSQHGAATSRAERSIAEGTGITNRSTVPNPIATVRDLPSNFFAVGRMHDARSFMVIDSKELVKRKPGHV